MNATAEKDDDLLTPEEVARLVRGTRACVYRWIRSGRLPALTRGGTRYVVRRADALRMLRPVEVATKGEARPGLEDEVALAKLRAKGYPI